MYIVDESTQGAMTSEALFRLSYLIQSSIIYGSISRCCMGHDILLSKHARITCFKRALGQNMRAEGYRSVAVAVSEKQQIVSPPYRMIIPSFYTDFDAQS